MKVSQTDRHVMNGDISESREDAPCGSAQQIARIATLLGELEELSGGGTEVPAPLLILTRASIEKVLGALKSYEQAAGSPGPAEDDSDPQPDIDGDLLERMYLSLGTGRRPPER
jgi:hypothetical protein